MMTKKEKKRVPELRFVGFEGEWERKKFSKYIKLYRGSSPRPIHKYQTNNEDGVNWIKIGDTKDVQNYTLKHVSEKITKEGAKKSRPVNKGELILANSMSFGKTYLLDIEGCIYDGWFVLREYEEYFNRSFLLQILNSEFLQRQYKRLSTGGVVQNISSDIVYSTILSKPELKEQQKIASFLTSIDTRIQQLEKKKTLLEQYKKGVMQRIFKQEIRFKDEDGEEFPRWEERTIKEVFKSLKGKGIPKKDIDENGKYECILYGELYTQYSEIVFDVKSRTNSADGLLSKKGDLLMPSSTTTTGMDLANITALNIDNVRLGGDMIILRSKKKINNIFYAYYLSNYKKNEIASRAQGITIVHIYYNSIKDLIIDVPSLEEQTKIAHFLSALDRKIAVVDEQIEKTKEWKKGLLQRMFV